MNENALFSDKEIMNFGLALTAVSTALAGVPLQLALLVVIVITLLVVGIVEFEIIYRVFEYLGGDAGYWSPGLMACSGMIMIIAFHLNAKNHPNSLAVRIVHRATNILLPIYLCGVGLFVAAMMFADGVADLLGQSVSLVPTESTQSVSQALVSALFENVTNPVAVLGLTIGLGGLTIINVFVAHSLMILGFRQLEGIQQRWDTAKRAREMYAKVQDSQLRFRQKSKELMELSFWDDNALALSVASQAYDVIDEGILIQKKAIKAVENERRGRFDPESADDLEATKASLAPIEAITLDQVLAIVNPPKRGKRK